MRFEARIEDPLRQWKLSPTDLESRRRWYDYSRARDRMLEATATAHAPWYIVHSDNKRRAPELRAEGLEERVSRIDRRTSVWGLLVVGTADNFIKPYLIGRGSDLPFILVLLGVLGGAFAFGVIGIFLGPTLLAVGYTVVRDWALAEPVAAAATPGLEQG